MKVPVVDEVEIIPPVDKFCKFPVDVVCEPVGPGNPSLWDARDVNLGDSSVLASACQFEDVIGNHFSILLLAHTAIVPLHQIIGATIYDDRFHLRALLVD